MYLPWVDVAAKVSEFVRRMEYSGYGDGFRYEVVKIVVRRHQRRLESFMRISGQPKRKSRIRLVRKGIGTKRTVNMRVCCLSNRL